MPKVGEREKNVIDLSFLCSTSNLYDFFSITINYFSNAVKSILFSMQPENRNKKM